MTRRNRLARSRSESTKRWRLGAVVAIAVMAPFGHVAAAGAAAEGTEGAQRAECAWGRGPGIGPGLDRGAVLAMTEYDEGLGPVRVAAGSFNAARGEPVHPIARWDGSSW